MGKERTSEQKNRGRLEQVKDTAEAIIDTIENPEEGDEQDLVDDLRDMVGTILVYLDRIENEGRKDNWKIKSKIIREPAKGR